QCQAGQEIQIFAGESVRLQTRNQQGPGIIDGPILGGFRHLPSPMRNPFSCRGREQQESGGHQWWQKSRGQKQGREQRQQYEGTRQEQFRTAGAEPAIRLRALINHSWSLALPLPSEGWVRRSHNRQVGKETL